MSLVYSDDSEPHVFHGSLSNINPTKAYLKHFENYLYLSFIALNSEDRIEKFQARKELVIAERKMDHWKKSPRFDQRIATEQSSLLKKTWTTKRYK